MIKSKSTKIGDWFIAFLCLGLIAICLLPMLHVAARSFSSSGALIRNEVWLLPKGFTLDSYAIVLKDARYSRAIVWTAVLTLMCTLLSLFMTAICAYPLTYDHLKGKGIINSIIIFTMYFGAGTIPTYLLLNSLNMINHPTVLMIPFCLSVFNMIIMRSFFYGIPESLRESAELDGAGPLRILVSIYLPLSTSVIATLALFYAVGRWNGYSDALIFMPRNRDYYPIQYLLFMLLQGKQSYETQDSTPGASEALRSASIMFATVPILLVYPWLQRYFITGATLGAVKG